MSSNSTKLTTLIDKKFGYQRVRKNGSSSNIQRGSDIVSSLAKINPPELHLYSVDKKRKYNFCGPFTRLQKRLARGDEGINRLDSLCKTHDIAYSKSTKNADRHIADRQMVAAINALPNPTRTEKMVRNIINTKQRFGLGVKKKNLR